MNFPEIKYPLAKPNFDGGEEFVAVTNCIHSGWVSSKGPYVQDLEHSMASLCEREYGVATSSGTSALHLALKILGIGPGDEVIVPTLTFVSPVNAILHCGATPVFCDSSEDSWQMCTTHVRELLSPRTKAVIAVHLYGSMCDIWELEDLCSANGIFLIEDAAEAIGASANGTPAGSFGWISCFSFFANKVITCGEGGMLLTNSKDLDTSARTYRDHGDDATDIARHYYEAAVPGFNYRMTNLQAGVALAQLKRLDYFLEERRRIDLDYRLNFFDEDLIRLQHIPRWCIPNGWMASFLVPDRDDTIIYLRQQGIESRPFFKPVHTMPYIQEPEQYPQAERYSAHGINLPTYVDLRTEDIKFICDKVLEITKSEGELVL